MYNLVTAFARSYDRSIGVRELDAASIKIRTLISENMDVYLVLTSPHLTGQHTLDLKDARTVIYNKHPDLTVEQWLLANGSNTLVTTAGTMKINYLHSKTTDAYVAGYKITPSTGFLASDDESSLEEDRVHVSLVQEHIDYVSMRKHVIASVGGYLHLTDSDTTAFYVRDAVTTMKISKSPKVTLHSFANVGELQLIPMSHCDITPRNQIDLYKGITITTDESLVDKTIWLSVGGYLLHLNQIYKVVGEHSIHLNWSKLDMFRKYMDSKSHIDLSAVDTAMLLSETSNGIVDKLDLDSNAAIKAYLNLSQSFIIIIDNPTVAVDMKRIEDTGLPGKYYVYGNPYLMYMGQDGRLPPVSLINERKAWVVSTSVEQGEVANYASYTIPNNDTTLFTNAHVQAKEKRRNSLYSLDISTAILETV